MNQYAAFKYRLKALKLSWFSTANWKYYDAFSTDNENERRTHLLEAQAYEVCAGNLDRLIDELPSHFQTNHQSTNPACGDVPSPNASAAAPSKEGQ